MKNVACAEVQKSKYLSCTKADYEYTKEEFLAAVSKKMGRRVPFNENDKNVVLIETRRLKRIYGFFASEKSGGSLKARIFMPSDSVLDKHVIEAAEPIIIQGKSSRCAKDNLDGEITKFIEKIEEGESRFESPIIVDMFFCKRFKNPLSFDTWDPKFLNPINFIRWLGENAYGSLLALLRMKKSVTPTESEINAGMKVERPKFKSDNEGISVTWLGHATCLVRVNGVNVLIDPIWAKRASSFSFVGPKRLVPPPIEIHSLPKLDVIVVSHDHYDHLDIGSVLELKTQSPEARWFVPLGLETYLKKYGLSNVTAMDWGMTNSSTPSPGKLVEITCVPSQHWGSRYLIDVFSRLWCGWVIKVGDKTIYYTGDTGFCRKEFLKIGCDFDIDLAVIPIGCYEPSWFMHPQHISPYEAVAVHEMTGAKVSIAVHWGTYAMGSSEPSFAPKHALISALKKRNIDENQFRVLNPGYTWTLSKRR